MKPFITSEENSGKRSIPLSAADIKLFLAIAFLILMSACTQLFQ